MAYQGTADLAAMAKDLSQIIINENWSDALATISKLNGLQTIFLVNCLKDHLSDNDLVKLVVFAGVKMNDNETGWGWISDNQED